MKKRIIFIVISISILAAGVFFSHGAYKKYQAFKKEQAQAKKRQQAWLSLKRAVENKAIHFNGRVSLIIEDLETGSVIAFNKDILLPSASLVKVPIMLSCFYAAEEGKVNLNSTIICKFPVSRISGDAPDISSLTLEELFEPMITLSDNDATNAIIDYMGFDTLSSYFKKMGLKNTNLVRKMLDFRKRRAGKENYTTAEDMAYLLRKLYYNNFLNKDVSQQCLSLLGQQKINDRIPRKLPKNGTFIAHKTGLERHICHDVGIVYTQKGDFLICVLVKHRDRLARNSKKLISEISLLTYNYYKSF